MHPTLMESIRRRRRRRAAMVLTLGVASVTSTAAAARRLHDSDLDLAAAAVEKAEGLLLLVQCGVPGEKSTEECDKEVTKASALLARARQAIVDAATAADGGESAPSSRN